MSQSFVFGLQPHPLVDSLSRDLGAATGQIATRKFPDGETYLRVLSEVNRRDCVVVADLSQPDRRYLPLVFLLATLRELGASSVGLVAPYLGYMRQDKRFQPGEAITSKVFAASLSPHLNWLVTVDPHLHRYHALEEIYACPSRVVHAAPLLADWLQRRDDVVLVGPDAESEQWVAHISRLSGHPYLVGSKRRTGDREVEVEMPARDWGDDTTAVIVDDVISSGQTIIQGVNTLRSQGARRIECMAVHGLFAGDAYQRLRDAGLDALITCNTVAHPSNQVDVTPLLRDAVAGCLEAAAQ